MQNSDTNTLIQKNNSPIREQLVATMGLIDEFETLLKTETEALRHADFETVNGLQDKKKDMAQRYNGMVANLHKRRDELERTDIKLRERFVEARTGFTVTLNENLKALQRIRESSQRLVDRIVDAMRKAVEEKQTTYKGYIDPSKQKDKPLSISVDQQL